MHDSIGNNRKDLIAKKALICMQSSSRDGLDEQAALPSWEPLGPPVEAISQGGEQ